MEEEWGDVDYKKQQWELSVACWSSADHSSLQLGNNGIVNFLFLFYGFVVPVHMTRKGSQLGHAKVLHCKNTSD